MRNNIGLIFLLVLLGPAAMAQLSFVPSESRCVNTGTIVVSGSFGAGGPYQLLVTNHPTTYTPGGAHVADSLPDTFAALFPGFYTIRVIDRNGAIYNSPAVEVIGNYILPGNNDYAPTATGVTNCLVPDGKIQGVLSHGRPPYTYKIIAGPAQVGVTNNTGTFTGLIAGDYKVQAADSCQNIQTRDITVTGMSASFSVTDAFVRQINCNSFSLDSIAIQPAFPSNGWYEIINYNSSGTGVVRATGNTFPVVFTVFSSADITEGKVKINVYDTCNNRVTNIPTGTAPSIQDGVINRIGCNRYSLDSLTITPPLVPGAIVQVNNIRTGLTFSSPLPVQFSATQSDIATGQIVVYRNDSCGISTSTAGIRNINNQWNFSPAFTMYCSAVVIDSLVFSGFVVTPYSVKVKALFTDSTGVIDSTSDQPVTSFPFTVAGIGGNPNPLTVKIEVKDSCGETKSITLTRSFELSSGVIRGLDCYTASIDLSLVGRYTLPVTYSVSPDPGVGSNTTGHFVLPEGVYDFIAYDSCGKRTSMGPLDLRRSWKVKTKQLRECFEPYLTNNIFIPSRSSGLVTVKQYDGGQPVGATSQPLRIKTFASTLNNCLWCGERDSTGEFVSFDSTLPGHTYSYIVTDSCGKTDTVTIVNDTVTLQFYHRAFAKTKCIRGSNVYANWNSNGDPLNTVTVQAFDANGFMLVGFNTGNITNMNNYPNGQLVLSDAPEGVYIIKYKLLYCNMVYVDTVYTKDYVQPKVNTAESFTPCSGGVPVIVNGIEGIGPYRYQVVNSTPGHFSLPSQLSPVFYLPVSQTTVTIRIVDACLNSSTRTVAITKALPPIIRTDPPLLSACTLPVTFNLLVDSVYSGSVFEWTKITGNGSGPAVIGRRTSLQVNYSSIADTGTYKVRVTVPNTCFDISSTFTMNNVIITCSPGIAGSVFNDANGLTDGIVNGRGTDAGGLYAILVNASNTVVAVSPVAIAGTYSFANVVQGNYSVIVSKVPGVINAAPPPALLPAGWVNTGEHAGILAGNDGAVNGKLQGITVDTAIITEMNFGIDRLPVANDTIEHRENPGGNLQVSVPVMTGSDEEDGIYDGVSGINTVIIQSLPVNAGLYYNGVPVSQGLVIIHYDPLLLTMDPNDNIATASFTFSEVDAAGMASIPDTVTVFFYGLPVNIVSLTATVHNKNILLNWLVGEQINVQQYMVEFSTDGINFTAVGQVAAGNNTNYTFMHTTPVKGINYYRLKITDRDGSVAYSKIVNARLVGKAPVVMITPNPFFNNILLYTDLLKASKITVIMYNTAGMKVYQNTFAGSSGSNRFTITGLDKLPKGLYIARIITGDFISQAKMIKD